MTRRAYICAGGILGVLLLWLGVRDTAKPPLGYLHLVLFESVWVSGLCWGYFTDVLEKREQQEQENHAHPRSDRKPL